MIVITLSIGVGTLQSGCDLEPWRWMFRRHVSRSQQRKNDVDILVESSEGSTMHYNTNGLQIFMLDGHIVARISDANYNDFDVIIDDNTSVSTM